MHADRLLFPHRSKTHNTNMQTKTLIEFRVEGLSSEKFKLHLTCGGQRMRRAMHAAHNAGSSAPPNRPPSDVRILLRALLPGSLTVSCLRLAIRSRTFSQVTSTGKKRPPHHVFVYLHTSAVCKASMFQIRVERDRYRMKPGGRFSSVTSVMRQKSETLFTPCAHSSARSSSSMPNCDGTKVLSLQVMMPSL